MKKNVRKALAISGMTLAIGASGLILDASANMGKSLRVQRFHQEGNGLRSTENKNRGRKSFSGVVSNISKNSITFSNSEKIFTARITGETRILDRSWNSILLTDIKNGDEIKVFGKSAENIITAKTVRMIFNQ